MLSESTLSDQHMQTLAMLIRDLDRELPATHSGTFSGFVTMLQYDCTVIG